jgi:pimeloyl-ACP methyl ester carboxylesterase
MKDIAFWRRELDQWEAQFPRAEVVRLAEAGHFVQEEAPLEVGEAVAGFLARTG